MGQLDRSPRANWVEKAGGLPSYIDRIAAHLHVKGMPISRAVATAVNVTKKMCAEGDLNFPGVQQVNANSRAQACAAVSEWEAKKAKAHAMTARQQAVMLTATEKEQQGSGSEDEKHPHQPKGQSNGGQFAPKGGGSGNQNTPEQDAEAKALFAKMQGMNPAQREAFLKGLNPDQLTFMRQFANSNDVDVTSSVALNGELGSRGIMDKAMNPPKAKKPKAPPKPKKTSSGSKSSGSSSAGSLPKPAPYKSSIKAAPKATVKKPTTTKPSTSKASTTKPTTGTKTTTTTPSTSPTTTPPTTTPASTRPLPPTTPASVRGQRYVGRARRAAAATAARKPKKTVQATAETGATMQLAAANLNTAQRNKLAPSAMDDQSYPIPSVLYLRKAIQSFGRCPEEKRAALVAHIRTRAKALGASDLPWVSNFLATHSAS